MALAVVLTEENQHDQALSWLLPAAESGYPEAQRNCAMLLLAVRGKEAATEAVDWLRRAACQGNSEAQFQLGQILYDGKLGLKDEVEGCFWAILATQGGHADARYLLKEMEWALSASQLAEAQTRANRFQPQRENKDAR